MKRIARGMPSAVTIAVIICCIGALCLLAAALQQPKHAPREGWVSLNKQVEEALAKWEGTGSGTETGAANGSEKPAASTMGTEMEKAAGSEDGTGTETSAGSHKLTEIADAAEGRSSSSAYYEGLLDINRATAEQLTSLPGIGPAKAQAIVAEREEGGLFLSKEDLLRVKGIGQKILDRLKENVVVRP